MLAQLISSSRSDSMSSTLLDDIPAVRLATLWRSVQMLPAWDAVDGISRIDPLATDAPLVGAMAACLPAGARPPKTRDSGPAQGDHGGARSL